MKISNKIIATLAIVAISATALFAQGPPPPPAVPLDGGITALLAFLTAGAIKLFNDKRKKN